MLARVAEGFSTGRLIYSSISSLDGYVADERGKFDWSTPDEEVHAFVNHLERRVGTYLYGRRMYDVMAAWESMSLADLPQVIRDYAGIWRAAEKIVYSSSLEKAVTARTTIERAFDVGAVRGLKARADADLSVGGPTLAAQALETGLVDELHLIVAPMVVGGGKRALPAGLRLGLELVGERRFQGGFVHLEYRPRG